MGYFKVSRHHRTLLVELDHPPVNTLSLDVLAEFQQLIAKVPDDVCCVIIASRLKKYFSAGGDIKEYASTDPSSTPKILSFVHAIYRSVETSDKIVIGAINGFCYGGALELATCFDIRIADKNARFRLPETHLGIIPGYGGSQRLPRLIGKNHASYMILTGNEMNAQQALAIGLVSEVVPAARLQKRCLAVGEEIGSGSPSSIIAAKKAIREGLESSLKQGLEREQDLLIKLFGKGDWKEGFQAFFEKRKPKF